MIRRKLTAFMVGLLAVSMVLSAFAQTTTKKKKKKKPKHTTSAPAAPAASGSASIELDETPPAAPSASAAPAPPASAAPSEATPAPAAGEENASASASSGEGAGGAMPWSVAGLVGWGFNGGANLGFGVRGGYTLPMHVYLGATFIYHLGESEFGGTANFFYPGVEGGYELPVGPFLVRPYAGLGPMILHESLPPITNAGVTVAQGTKSTTYFAFWPGVTGTYPVTPRFFVGVDLRYILSSYLIFETFATAGGRF